jgi:hypothetical protein
MMDNFSDWLEEDEKKFLEYIENAMGNETALSFEVNREAYQALTKLAAARKRIAELEEKLEGAEKRIKVMKRIVDNCECIPF